MNKSLIITKNELLQFFSSLSGYIFIGVFVIIYAWFFSMPMFVKNAANLSAFFETVQLLFIVYIPIITMNLIAKEKQAGTIETLFTLPLKTRDFILGKFLTGFVIVLISLVPSIVHFVTILALGINVDYGILFCGYLSLVLTAGVYCALGIFVGVLTSNQIVSFICSFMVILVFFLMDNIMIFLPLKLTPILQYISITWQNTNLIKGVIDTRVLVYFLSLILIFLYSAVRSVFGSRFSVFGNYHSRSKRRDTCLPNTEHRTPNTASTINFLLTLLIILCLNIVSLYVYKRFDLTKTKAYSLSQASKNVIDNLDSPVRISLFFSKNLPGQLIDARRYTQDLLSEYQTYSRGNISFEFINPDSEERFEEEARVVEIAPVSIEVYERDKVEFRDIYMGAAVFYKQKKQLIPFIGDTEGIEFLLTNTIKKLSEPRERHIAYFQPVYPWEYQMDEGLTDEILLPMPNNTMVFNRIVSDMLVLDRTDLLAPLPQSTDLLIVNAVKDSLSQRQLFMLDQYIMRGKPTIILTDRYVADLNHSPAKLFDNNLIAMLRSYGIFVRPALVLDSQCFMVSQNRMRHGVLVPVDFHYPFFPAIRSFSDTLVIHKNLHWVQSYYASEVINLNRNLKNTPLLWTSDLSSEIAGFEVETDFETFQNTEIYQTFNMPSKALMQMFEGEFQSLFANADIPTANYIKSTQNGKIIVAGTTSLLENYLLSEAPSNEAFILNLIDYLTDHTDFIYMRSRNITFSPFVELSYQQKSDIKYANLILPFVLILAFAGVFYLNFMEHKERVKDIVHRSQFIVKS